VNLGNIGGWIRGGLDPLGLTGRNPVSDMLTGAGHIDDALAAQTGAAGQARSDLMRMWQEQQRLADPWLQTGQRALSDLAAGNFMQNWQTDPGYQFRLQQGLKAIQGSAAARGLNQSGATLKALTEYGQNLASQEYQNIYNREYGRLSDLARMGTVGLGGLMGAAGQHGQSMANIATGLGNAQAAAQMAHQQARQGLLGTVGSVVGAIFSDKRVKKDLGKISKADIEEFKKSIKPYRFKYKDESMGDGEWVGVMAQDLEKSKLGRTVVEERDGVKVVNLKKLASLGLAMMADEAS